MTVDFALFVILALIAIGSALGMLLSRSAVYAALFLVLSLRMCHRARRLERRWKAPTS